MCQGMEVYSLFTIPSHVANKLELLEQPHQLVESFAKWKKLHFLHILVKKTPTSVGVKLCIYAQLL